MSTQRDRIEQLRGLCKTAVGYLRDAGDVEQAEQIAGLIGDMEPAPSSAVDSLLSSHERLQEALSSLVLVDSNSRELKLHGYARGSQMWQCWEAARAALAAIPEELK